MDHGWLTHCVLYTKCDCFPPTQSCPNYLYSHIFPIQNWVKKIWDLRTDTGHENRQKPFERKPAHEMFENNSTTGGELQSPFIPENGPWTPRELYCLLSSLNRKRADRLKRIQEVRSLKKIEQKQSCILTVVCKNDSLVGFINNNISKVSGPSLMIDLTVSFLPSVINNSLSVFYRFM